jgi:tetratricopeptide (TPR) repeat protein
MGLLLPAGVPAAFAQQSDAELFARAVAAHQTGDFEAALEAYQSVLKAQPDHVQALSNIGAVHARLGQHDKAIEYYRKALEIDGFNLPIRFNLGLAYYRAAQLPDTVAELTRVVAAQPENRNATLLLADCYLRMERHKEVIALLSPLEEKSAGDRAVNYLLGTALIRENQIERGQALIDRILRDGDSAEAHLMLGHARMMGRDYRGALEEFHKAVELNPRLPSANAYYGRALMATGDTAGAVAAYQQELEIDANNFDAHLYLGVLLKKDRRFDEALGHLERALHIRPGSPRVRYQIGSLHVSTGKTEEALAVLGPLVAEYPKFVEARVSLATVYYRLKRKEEGDREGEVVRQLSAERQRNQPQPGGSETAESGMLAETLDPTGFDAAGPEIAAGPEAPAPANTEPGVAAADEFEVIASRASLAREADRVDEAIELYRQTVERKPDWAEGWWYLGSLYYTTDRHGEAREAFRKLVELKPEGGVGWAMLGLCEFKLEQYSEALDNLQRARALGLAGGTQLTTVARYHLALLLNRSGDSDSALQVLYGLASQEGGDSPAIIEAMGTSALRLNVLPAGIPPEKRPLVERLGQAQYYSAAREAKKAQEIYEELIEQYPGEANVRYSYGVFLLVGDSDGALQQFDRALEIAPGHAVARLQIAFEHLKRGDFARARSHAEEAVELESKNFVGHYALGRALLGIGEVEQAVEQLETALKLAPDSPETCFSLAQAYARAGKKEQAARMRERFQELDKKRRGWRGQ